MFLLNKISGKPDSCSEIAEFTTLMLSSDCFSGSGILANFENSSTIRLRSLVCLTITSVILASVSPSLSTRGMNFRFILSADNLIGVSGFLIS